MNLSRISYCQYLLASQGNYTLTYFSEHSDWFSHDLINRFLKREKYPPRLIWEQVSPLIEEHPNGYLLFDDTVADKRYSNKIELVRRQYSGNAHGVIRGIGIVTCVYVNPDTEEFWLIDYRIYDPQGDGKTKLDHVRDMLDHTVYQKKLSFQAVLMDTWYATKDLMLQIESLQKVYYCPIKHNRQVDDSGGISGYQAVETLEWSEEELASGKRIKIKGFPKEYKVQCFRVEVSTHRTDYVVTNDKTQLSTEDVQQACRLRWKIEQLHRESKQLTGLESCQCRKARIQRNHIACAFLVWVRLKQLAKQVGQTVYQLKQGLLDDYLCSQLKNPSLSMTPA